MNEEKDWKKGKGGGRRRRGEGKSRGKEREIREQKQTVFHSRL